MKILWGPDFRQGLDQALRRTLADERALELPHTPWESKAFNYELPGTQVSTQLPALNVLCSAHLPEAEWVFLLEPHKRLPPRHCFQSGLPLIAFADCPVGLSETDICQLFSLYDGLVALSEKAFSLFTHLGLPVLQTRWQGIEPALHYPLPEPEPLYDLMYIASNPYSPALPDYESLPAPWKCRYFIATTPAFLPFYFQRSRYVICDDPGLTARLLESLACGAVLLCPEGFDGLPPALQVGEHYLNYAPGQLGTVLATLEADPPRRRQILDAVQAIMPNFSLQACFRSLQVELKEKSEQLNQRVLNRLQAEASSPLLRLETEALTLIQADNPLALTLLPDLLKDPLWARDQRYYSGLVVNYVRAAFHPLNLTAAGPLLQAAHQCLAELPPRLQALQALVWAWKQQHWGLALHHLAALKGSTFSLMDFPPLLVAQEQIYLSLSVWYPPQQALELSLKLIELECLQGLGRWPELRVQAESVLTDAPLAPFFQLYLQALTALQDAPALLGAYAAAEAACPLEIPIRLHGAALLGESQPEQAMAQVQAGRDLAQRHMMALESVEIFHALERLIWHKHPALFAAAQEPHREGYLLWEGAIQSHHSLARINRRLLELLQTDPSLYFTTLPFHPPEFTESEPPGDLNNHWQWPDALISHRWPPRLLPPQQGKWVNILPWEHGVLPESWVQTFNAALDQVWVPSAFVARSFEHSGLVPERIRVIPNGVDTALYCPDGPQWPLPQRKKTVFLFVGGLIQRKGIDLLLKAYAQAFSADDDVALVIKGFGDQGVYSTGSLAEPLAFFRENPAAPALHLITRSDLSEQDLAALYRACDVYVHPYRGEGFGLPILEAMACGLPVVVPEAGPAPEFSSSDSAWYLPTWTAFELGKSLGDIGLTPFYPYYHEVDVAALAQCLRQIATEPELIAQKGRAARKEAEAYAWQAMAERIRIEIRGLCNQQPAIRDAAAQAQAAWQSALEQPGHWPELSELPIPAAIEPCLPGLQSLLSQCLETGQQLKFKAYLGHAWERGLSLEQYLRLNLAETELEKRPLRVFWPEPALFFAPVPDSSALLQFVPVPAQTRFQLQTQALGSGTSTWVWLQTPVQILPEPAAVAAVFYAHPEQGLALKALGWSEQALLYLPPAVDFEVFSPLASPLVLEESQGRFCFFACLDFSPTDASEPVWQRLLQAYLQTFAEPEPVNLVIKPLRQSFDLALEQVMAWLENQGVDPEQIPSLTFVQEELGPHNLPGLYTGSQVFIEVDPSCDGMWALAAQAAGCKLIAARQFPFLERPFAEQAVLNDPMQLAWLLRKAFEQPLTQLSHSGRAVREYLRASYDLPRWQQRIQTFAGRSFLAQAF